MVDKEIRSKLLEVKDENDFHEILCSLYLEIHKEIYSDKEIRSVLCKVLELNENELADVFLHNGPPSDFEDV